MDFIMVLKVIAALATAATGLLALVKPDAAYGFIGLNASGVRGVSEIRAIFGGLFIALGLAPLVVENLIDTIAEINKTGTTILLVEQDVQIALEIAGRGYVLETGRVVLQGSNQALLADDRVRKAYLGM